MSIKLKPINEQVIVITGASSGIGLATAEEAATRGAKVVLAARSIDALNEIVARINASGGTALAVECDVANRAAVEALATRAVEHFGRIDTWVNDAGLGLYGRIDKTAEEDARKLFDINFWGLYYGCMAALPHLKNGGALINVGSEVSEATAPLLGFYAATKHAVKGLNDTLRIEIEEVDKLPISITLIQPTAVDTPFPQHAKNFMEHEPKLPTPMIEARQVAEAICDAAVTPTRFKKVGLMAKINTTLTNLIPSLADKAAAKQVNRMQYDESPRNPDGALHHASENSLTAGHTQGSGGREKNDR